MGRVQIHTLSIDNVMRLGARRPFRNMWSVRVRPRNRIGQRADEHYQISALPLDFGLTLMIACQDAVLSVIPVTEIAGVTRRRCTTT